MHNNLRNIFVPLRAKPEMLETELKFLEKNL